MQLRLRNETELGEAADKQKAVGNKNTREKSKLSTTFL